MIEIEGDVSFVEELLEPSVESGKIKAKSLKRPFVLNAKTYKLVSMFVDYPIYITLTYTEEEGRKRPFEMFINSKDLTKAAEYAVLTRLISAIFRRSEDPTFIIEELQNIYDPNGGYFKDGRYIPSIYAEIADVLERFFEELGLVKRGKKTKQLHLFSVSQKEGITSLKVCPSCNQKSLKVEGGCITCINPDCGYSKCEG